MQNSPGRAALSRTISIGIVVVIVVAALGGYFILAPKSGSSSTTSTGTGPTLIGLTTSTSNQNTFTGSTETNVATSLILTGTSQAAFYKQQVVTMKYSQAFTCNPGLASFATNKTEANAAAGQTSCEVGGGNSTVLLTNAQPVFLLVPAFAGLSVFGVPALGSTGQGYPTFEGKLIQTNCGAGGTASACADHPSTIYSSLISQAEQSGGIKSGTGGMPEGVLSIPAHSQLVDFIGGPSTPWWVVAVLVFDPNIFPDATTGQCHQWVTSDLQNPTGNCLNSMLDLSTALQTTTSATAKANSAQADPFYSALGSPQTQVVIPGGATFVSSITPPNSNLVLYFSVTTGNPYGP